VRGAHLLHHSNRRRRSDRLLGRAHRGAACHYLRPVPGSGASTALGLILEVHLAHRASARARRSWFDPCPQEACSNAGCSSTYAGVVQAPVTMQHRRLLWMPGRKWQSERLCRHDACLSARADAGESAYINCSRAPIYPGQRSIVGCIIQQSIIIAVSRSCYGPTGAACSSGDSRALVDLLRRGPAPGPTRKTTLRGLRTRLHASATLAARLLSSARSHLPFLKPSRTITFTPCDCGCTCRCTDHRYAESDSIPRFACLGSTAS
jgi:hypothetical protein